MRLETTSRCAVRWYVGVVLTLTALGGALHWLVAPPNGLVRTFRSNVGLADELLFRDRTTEVSLAFMDENPALPRRFFSVDWSGFWFLPQAQTVDLYAGADDSVTVLVDGQIVLQRNPVVGMHTIGKTITLSAGPHEIVVRYEQQGGGSGLNLQHALTGRTPSPLVPTQLFPERPGILDFLLATGTDWLVRLVAILWLASGAGLLTAIAWPVGLRALRYWRAVGAPRTASDFGRRLFLVAFPALLGPFVLFLLGPHTIYSGNRGEFSSVFSDIAWPWLLLALGGGWAILLGIGCVVCLVSARLTRLYAALLLALGVLFWAQGNLWVGDYGTLDGRAVEWNRLAGRVPYELAAWGVVPLLAVLFSRPVSRFAPFAAQLFLLLQTGALAITWDGPDTERPARWAEPPPALFQLSSQRNVIHFVLDEFQSDVFGAMLEQERTWFDQTFTGFTYFPDHLGAFPSTSLSIPAMLTGKEFRNEQPVREFVRQAFTEGSILGRLSGAGYAIDATSIMPTPWFEDWFVPEGSPVNLDGARFSIRKPFVSRSDYRRFKGRELLELSVSRHVPHVVKVALSENPTWFDRMFVLTSAQVEASNRRWEASNSAAFFEQFVDTMSLGRGRPVYKLLHVGFPHRPIVLDADCGFIDQTPFSLEGYLGQSRCAIKLVAAFLNRLRDLGIYENSLIVVSSDHGTDLQPFDFTGRSASLPLSRGASTSGLPAIAGSARPLMVIKPPLQPGPLTISTAPTAQADLPATILALLGLSPGLEGEPMFERDPTAPRRRVYGMYDLRWRFPQGYLDRLDLLTVERTSTDATGWNFERTIMPPDQRLPAADVDFGGGDNTMYLGPGWSPEATEVIDGEEEVSFVNGLGRRGVIFVSLPRGAVELVARLSAPADGGLESIEVALDGRSIGRWRPLNRHGYQDYAASIPADPARPSISTITFHFGAPATDNFLMKLDRISFRTQ